MKALTVRQPSAWSIFHGKDVENRSGWRYTYTGPLVIHAGLHLGDQLAWAEAHAHADTELEYFGKPGEPTEAAFGALIGVVDLGTPHWWEDCKEPSGRLCSPWARRERWHLPVSRQTPFLEPIPCPGRQGLWEAPRGTVDAIRKVW